MVGTLRFAHPTIFDLILRRRVAASRRMSGKGGAAWFETREGALLTMKV
jgi:hypothetical protein